MTTKSGCAPWKDLCICRQINSFKHITQYTLVLFFLLHLCFKHWLARPLLRKYSYQFPADEGASRLFAIIFCALRRGWFPLPWATIKSWSISRATQLSHPNTCFSQQWDRLFLHFGSKPHGSEDLSQLFCKRWYNFVVTNLRPHCLDVQAGSSHLVFKLSPPQKGHDNSTCLTGFIRLSG